MTLLGSNAGIESRKWANVKEVPNWQTAWILFHILDVRFESPSLARPPHRSFGRARCRRPQL